MKIAVTTSNSSLTRRMRMGNGRVRAQGEKCLLTMRSTISNRSLSRKDHRRTSPYEEEKDRKWGKDSRWKLYEAEDEEEAEIINRHLGKWGDRVARPSRGEKKPERRDSRDERERFTDRESRQEARKSFFAGKSPKEFGERKASFEGRRGERDERRPRRDGERPARKFDGQKGEGRPFRGKKK